MNIQIENNIWERISYLVCITFFVILLFAAFRRNILWGDDIVLWRDVVKKSPYRARGHNNLGNAYNNKGQYDRAIENFNKALALDPNYTHAYYNLGAAYGNKGQHDMVIESFNKAIALNPNDALAYYNLGTAYNNKGQHDRAI